MRILVIGAGATGGYYGGRLAQHGRDVTFLVRTRRADQLRETGLMVQTPEEEFRIEPNLISAAELPRASPFDVILLSVKAYGFERAVEDFAPAVGPETMILPVLNGMRHLDALDARFGRDRVLGGLCRIVGDMDADGRVIQLTELNELAYGERNRERTARIEALHKAMSGCGFDATLSPDILAFMWVKWMMLASLGAINTLGRGTIGKIAAVTALDGAGLRMQHRVLDEAIAIATAEGYPPAEAAEKMMRERMTKQGSTLVSSMYRDLTRGFAVEGDQILGDMVARGRSHGLLTPLLEAGYVQLSVHEHGRPHA